MMHTFRFASLLAALTVALGCSHRENPTAPTPIETSPFPATVRLTVGQTTTVPLTTLELTYEQMAPPPNPHAVDCAGPCGPYGASTMLVFRRAPLEQRRTFLYVSQPVGGDRTEYGGFRIRLVRLEPAWNPANPRPPGDYAAVFEVAPE
jgi:hypothetical protein